MPCGPSRYILGALRQQQEMELRATADREVERTFVRLLAEGRFGQSGGWWQGRDADRLPEQGNDSCGAAAPFQSPCGSTSLGQVGPARPSSAAVGSHATRQLDTARRVREILRAHRSED